MLLVAGDGGVRVGAPQVQNARVIAEVVEHLRGDKIRIFKYKNKTRYRRRMGHRQDFTRLTIREILTSAPEADKPPAKPRRAAGKAAAPAPAKGRAETEAPAPVEAETPEPQVAAAEGEAQAPAKRSRARRPAKTEAAEASVETPPEADVAPKPARRPRAKKAAPAEAADTGE